MKPRFYVFLGLSLLVCSTQAALVDYTGLSLSGSGSFNTTLATSGETLISSVTVRDFTPSAGNSGTITSAASGQLARMEDPAASAGQTLSVKIHFDSIQLFTVTAFSGSPSNTLPSNVTDVDELTFIALNSSLTPLTTFAGWTITNTTLLNVVSNSGNTIIINGTKGPTSAPFATFDLTPNEAIYGYQIVFQNRSGATGGLNSSQLALQLAVIPEPSTMLFLAMAGGLLIIARLRRLKNLSTR